MLHVKLPSGLYMVVTCCIFNSVAKFCVKPIPHCTVRSVQQIVLQAELHYVLLRFRSCGPRPLSVTYSLTGGRHTGARFCLTEKVTLLLLLSFFCLFLVIFCLFCGSFPSLYYLVRMWSFCICLWLFCVSVVVVLHLCDRFVSLLGHLAFLCSVSVQVVLLFEIV